MKETVRIGSRVLPSDPFWVLVRENLRQRAQELGVTLVNVNLPLETVTGEAQLSLFDDLFAQELDALITPRVPEALAQRLVAGGLPLVFADETEYSHPGMICPRGLGDAAAMAARFLLARIDGRGTVVMIGGEDHHLPTVRRRVEDFLAPIAACPAVRCIHIKTLWRYEEGYETIMEEAPRWRAEIGAGPLAGVYGLSDSLALAGRDAFRALGLADDTTQIVGINGDPLALAAIISGAMHATVETSALDMARRMLDYACRAGRGETLPPHFPFDLRLVTSENAAAVAAEKLVSIADVPSRLVDVNLRHEQQRIVQMRTSLELNRRVGSILDGPQLLRELADIIRSRYEFDRVQLFWWREGDGCLVLDQPPAAANHDTEKRCIHLPESGALGQSLMRNQVVYIPDTLTSQRFAPDPAWPDCRSRVVLPIRVGGKTLGVLDLHSARRSARSQLVLDGLQALADQLGIAWRNAQLYAQALEAKAEAEAASRLKSRLLANVSHELRTPLNIVLGYSEAALEDPSPYGAPLPGELLQDLRHIQRSGQQLGRLIDDLLNLSQAEVGALDVYPQELDPRALLAETFYALAGSSGQPRVEWRLQLPQVLPPLHADPVRLRQVLLNLLSNAARFTVEGHVTLRAAHSEDELHIVVEDTGPGIEPPLGTSSFPGGAPPTLSANLPAGVTTAAFVESVRAQHGAGLGLQVAHHLVALHGGTLAIFSRPGHGTLFEVRLPLCAGKERPPLEAAAVPAAPETGELLLQACLRRATSLSRALAAYVAENYAAPVSREEISAALKVSPNYLSRVFRQDTGLTPWQYLSQFRVVQAQKLLLTTELSVTEVAQRVGFSDPAYFVRVFHKETGRAPLQYRKSAK